MGFLARCFLIEPGAADNDPYTFYDNFVAFLGPVVKCVPGLVADRSLEAGTVSLGCEMLDAMLCLGLERTNICSGVEAWGDFCEALLGRGEVKVLVSLSHENGELVEAMGSVRHSR